MEGDGEGHFEEALCCSMLHQILRSIFILYMQCVQLKKVCSWFFPMARKAEDVGVALLKLGAPKASACMQFSVHSKIKTMQIISFNVFDPAAVVRTMRALADVESADRISQGTCFVRISYASMVSQ